MAAISGHKAAIKLTGAAVTTSTDQAAVLSTNGVTLQVSNASRRHWDDESLTHPVVYGASTTVPLSAATYTVNFVQGIVTFTTPHSTSITYTIDSQWVTASSWGNARQWTVAADQPLLDGTVFGTTWRKPIPGLRQGGVSVSGFWSISGASTSPFAYDYLDTSQKAIVELYPQSSRGDRYEGYAWVANNQVGASVDGLVGETVDLTLNGPLYYSSST